MNPEKIGQELELIVHSIKELVGSLMAQAVENADLKNRIIVLDAEAGANRDKAAKYDKLKEKLAGLGLG